MTAKRIHIVSFDIPFPANYGGVQDVFSRVEWLVENNWEVHLHCFEYNRKPSKKLEKICQVYYYKRPRSFLFLLSRIPFIVKTRINEELMKRLANTEDVVLLEGLHTSWYVTVQPHRFWVRTHNIEHSYYKQLAEEARFYKKWYFKWEAKKLARYENILKLAKGILAITPLDRVHFAKIQPNTLWLPPVFRNKTHFVETERFVLYHGNLSVEENAKAVRWILHNVLPLTKNVRFVFAGKRPSKDLEKEVKAAGIELICNPSEILMTKLIQSAYVHLLWTGQSTGIKLKLLHALSGSGHVLCNDKMILGTELAPYVHIATSGQNFAKNIKELMVFPLTENEWINRTHFLTTRYGDNAIKDTINMLKI
jgi:hypothetical protein